MVGAVRFCGPSFAAARLRILGRQAASISGPPGGLDFRAAKRPHFQGRLAASFSGPQGVLGLEAVSSINRRGGRLAAPKPRTPGGTKTEDAWRHQKRGRLAAPKLRPPGGTETEAAWRHQKWSLAAPETVPQNLIARPGFPCQQSWQLAAVVAVVPVGAVAPRGGAVGG